MCVIVSNRIYRGYTRLPKFDIILKNEKEKPTMLECKCMHILGASIVLFLLVCSAGTNIVAAQNPNNNNARIVDDFNGYEEGAIPAWWGLQGRRVFPLDPSMREAGEYYAIHVDESGKFLRMQVKDESVRIVMPNEEGMDWSLEDHPRISWQWRVQQMPDGAREDRDALDDTAGAVYITFSFNFFGQPRSIKYTYSSTLPVGTVVSQGRLKVIVVASGPTQLEKWIRIDRDVAEDYRIMFGKNPPDRPVSIALWSDSDSIHGMSEIDIDNVMLLAPGSLVE